MRFALLTIYRPVRTSDGRHGFTEGYLTAVNLWGAIRPHENMIVMTYRHGEDVKVDDVIVAEDGCYRITTLTTNPGSPMGNAVVNRIQRPIFPDGETCVGSGSGP